MPEVRITFEKEWSPARRLSEINKVVSDQLKGCRLIALKLEKEIGKVGPVTKREVTDWTGGPEQELMLKTATSFLVKFEKPVSYDGIQ